MRGAASDSGADVDGPRVAGTRPLGALDQQTATRGDADGSASRRMSIRSLAIGLPAIKPDVQGAAAIRLHVSGANVRWASPLGRALTELAILTTAREHDQPYEWSLHEMEAVAVGLDPATIDIVRHRRPLTGRRPRQAARSSSNSAARSSGRTALSSATYARALKTARQERTSSTSSI